MMKGQLAGLMKQAQAMQDNLKKAQDELALIEVSGESGAGLVKIRATHPGTFKIFCQLHETHQVATLVVQ